MVSTQPLIFRFCVGFYNSASPATVISLQLPLLRLPNLQSHQYNLVRVFARLQDFDLETRSKIAQTWLHRQSPSSQPRIAPPRRQWNFPNTSLLLDLDCCCWPRSRLLLSISTASTLPVWSCRSDSDFYKPRFSVNLIRVVSFAVQTNSISTNNQGLCNTSYISMCNSSVMKITLHELFNAVQSSCLFALGLYWRLFTVSSFRLNCSSVVIFYFDHPHWWFSYNLCSVDYTINKLWPTSYAPSLFLSDCL